MKEAWNKMMRSIGGQAASECVAILGVAVLVLAASVHPFSSRVPGLFACYGSAGAAAQISHFPGIFGHSEFLAAADAMTGNSQGEASSGDDFLHLRA